MFFYEIANFKVPSTLLTVESLYNKGRVKTNPSAVTIYSQQKQAISFNSSDEKVIFQEDDSIYKSIKHKINSNIYYTYPKQISLPLSFVVHDNSFSQNKILEELYGINIEEETDKFVEFLTLQDDGGVLLEFTIPEQFRIYITSQGVYINDRKMNKDFTFKIGTVTIKSAYDVSLVYKDKIKKDRVLVKLEDNNIKDYYYELDVENNILTKKEIVFSGIDIDPYSSVMKLVGKSGLGSNVFDIYDFKNKKYFESNEPDIVTHDGNKIQQYEKHRLMSANIENNNNTTMYDYGFFKANAMLIVGYVYVSKKYLYLSYYFSKQNDFNECDVLQNADDNEMSLAIKFKIVKGKGIEIKTQKIDYVDLIHKDADFADKLYKSIKHGVGVFSNSLFDIKKYKDDGIRIVIEYNYRNSNNKYTLSIEDGNTRYVISDERKVNGNTSTETKRYYRYKTYPEVEMNNTKSKVNMSKKKLYDAITDKDNGTILFSKISVSSYSIEEKNSILNINNNSFEIEFPKQKVATTCFARVSDTNDKDLILLNIVYHPNNDNVTVEYDNHTISLKDFVDYFNEKSDYFKFDYGCAYSKVEYKTLENKNMEIEFPITTLFAIEPINGPKGMYSRIYYKNMSEVGFFEAIKFNIIR